jgi:hypothetical protein
MLLPTALLLSATLSASCRDLQDPAAAHVSDLAPAFVITEDSMELSPNADRYYSTTGTASTGTETTLPLTKDRRPLLRWDSVTLAETVGSDSLVEAFLDLAIVSNGGGWGGQGKQVGVHKVGTPWTETGGFPPGTPLIFAGAADSTVFTNGQQGVVTFIVTASIRNVLQSSPGDYVQGFMVRLAQESGPASVTFGSRESGNPPRLRLIVQRQTPPVPIQAPDTLPSDLHDGTKIRQGTACGEGRAHRDLISITFVAGATQSQRQAAIDLVNGQVAGGRRRGAGEGRYYVRIPYDESGQNLCDAEDALNALPQVLSASMVVYPVPTHRQPIDGPGWSTGDWSLRADALILNPKWGLEAIAAPLAWGCEVGSEEVALAVVDAGFQSAVQDLHDQVSPQWRNDIDRNFLTFHGSSVSVVAAGMGNDTSGMTGVMWRADLRPYDVRVAGNTVNFDSLTTGDFVDKIVDAVNDGAEVINLSSGTGWRGLGAVHCPGPPSRSWAICERSCDTQGSLEQDSLALLAISPLLL